MSKSLGGTASDKGSSRIASYPTCYHPDRGQKNVVETVGHDDQEHVTQANTAGDLENIR